MVCLAHFIAAITSALLNRLCIGAPSILFICTMISRCSLSHDGLEPSSPFNRCPDHLDEYDSFNCQTWCPPGDSNSQSFRRWLLKPECIPFHQRGIKIKQDEFSFVGCVYQFRHLGGNPRVGLEPHSIADFHKILFAAFILKLAEEVGVEPTRAFLPRRISSAVPSPVGLLFHLNLINNKLS